MEKKQNEKKAMCESADKHNRKHVQKYKKNVRVIQLESKKGCSEHKKRWMAKSVSYKKKM